MGLILHNFSEGRNPGHPYSCGLFHTLKPPVSILRRLTAASSHLAPGVCNPRDDPGAEWRFSTH